MATSVSTARVIPDLASVGVTTAAALVPAADRSLPVDEALAPLFPIGGLGRGQVIGLDGPGAMSLAFGVALRAVVTGSWLAIVGRPDVGVEAAVEMGMPLERMVAIDAGTTAGEWADRVATCADGFEVVMTSPPPRSDSMVRRVRQRLTARGSVLLLVDANRYPDNNPAGRDLTFETTECRWVGVGQGSGALLARMVTISAAGRRLPRPRRHQVWLPDHEGRLRAVHDAENADGLVC